MKIEFSKLNPELIKLLNDAADHAESSMREQGKLDPFFLGASPKGSFIIGTPGHASRDFETFIRFACVARAARAGVLALEAWVLLSKPGEVLDLKIRPSQSPRRQEAVVLLGESTSDQPFQAILPILRETNGKFAGFGNAQVAADNPSMGRFSRMVPSRTPLPETQKTALETLKSAGFTVSGTIWIAF